MRDGYNRSIDYLRISVTDRCNFRCAYCMPPDGVKLLDHADILAYEEILYLIKVFNKYGVNKIRLTGGEPLVRKGIVDFIRALSSLGIIDDLSLTTNGSLLADMAEDLKAAGLHRVNVSLDTVDPERFRRITGSGSLERTLAGIEKAITIGLHPVKINVVLTSAFMDSDLSYFIEMVYRYPIAVRFIEYMPIGYDGTGPGMAPAEVKDRLNAAGLGMLEPATGSIGNGPAKYYRLPGAKGLFGFITPITEHFCGACNRMRLTADGKLRPCLLSNRELDLKTLLRAGASEQQLGEVFLRALSEKPAGHNLAAGQPSFRRKMSQIGG
ncbi:molybdenum cofactor biosynthesis protein A [Thermosinus carboxydivorans Nor1]|uniref:GTP 3',8-cyclase n=1 Tax=Thermosinus carboxydivorans Nor1 TaxID=401526 RepID=A1HS17_9FIRM|nr:GTP 3',8-cyclase MoaA [Thermosinus carboxydivorans]EAX47193.1 molybdenum cofactor biosynthesis protein A [Thermosinus carboxydivorans Nor1]